MVMMMIIIVHHHGIRMAFMGLGKPKRLLRPAGGACEILQEDLALAQGLNQRTPGFWYR